MKIYFRETGVEDENLIELFQNRILWWC